MKKSVKIIAYIALCCATLWLMFWVLFWIHMHSRIDTSLIVDEVARKLHVQPDKLFVLNEARRYCPVVVFICHDDKMRIIDNCESLIPSEEVMGRLTESVRNQISRTYHKEFDMAKKRIIREFEMYGIVQDEPIEHLYYVKANGAENIIVVETKGKIYVLCRINGM